MLYGLISIKITPNLRDNNMSILYILCWFDISLNGYARNLTLLQKRTTSSALFIKMQAH